eukprot:TRINITY_DN1382_c0_g1_i2.p1 TRINITY_DN1382_c0_g1~~TRINITY_DN1382_c0_g1_i2.p1  ORF type:complete len:278 (+),score=66.38 TRINITY_DN1382_c0_g1_i2:150-983(+)
MSTQALQLPSLFENYIRPYFDVTVREDGSEYIDLPAMQWYYVPAAIVFYISTLYMIWPQKNAKVVKLSGTGKALVLLHNLLLMAYSMLVLYESLPLLVNCYFAHGSLHSASVHCKGLSGAQMMFWGWTFYFSKMYEFLDTFILCWRNIQPSFLQMYHHTGAVFAMWWVVADRHPIGWSWVVQNSFIHSVMYAYYSATTVGIRPPGKQILTAMQIIQFINGNIISFGHFYGELNTSQFYNMVYNQVYSWFLILLFLNFVYNTYIKKGKKKSKPSVKEA